MTWEDEVLQYAEAQQHHSAWRTVAWLGLVLVVLLSLGLVWQAGKLRSQREDLATQSDALTRTMNDLARLSETNRELRRHCQ